MTELRHLGLFVERVDEAAQTRFLQNFRGTELNIRFDHMKGLEVKNRDVPEEDLRSFLLTFRQFMMDREPVNLSKMFNFCDRHLTDDALREELRKARTEWKQALKQSPLQLTHNGTDMTPKHVGDLLINGHYFHSDEAKRAQLDSLMPMGQVLSRYIFLNLITDVIKQVFFLRHLILVGIRRDAFSPTPVK